MKKLFTLFTFALLTTVVGTAQTQVLADTTLEISGAGPGPWTSTSTNFGTAFCTAAVCGTCGGPCVPHSGLNYVWFGGTANAESGTLSQTFNVATGGAAQLEFWLMIPNGRNASDSLTVRIDGALVYHKLGDDTVGFESAYAQVSVPAGTLASGSHTILIASNQAADAVVCNILVDDVTLKIAGNVGTETILLDENINMFHSGAENTLYMNFMLNEESDMAVSIIDMNGRIVLFKNYNNIQNEMLTFNTTGLSTGIYTVNFIKGNSSAISKKIYIQQ